MLLFQAKLDKRSTKEHAAPATIVMPLKPSSEDDGAVSILS